MVKIKWKLTEVVVSAGGGGTDEPPEANFQVSASQIGESYSDVSGMLVGVTCALSKEWGSTVTVPYTLTGTATYLEDYWKGKSETDGTQESTIALEGGGYGQFFRFSAGVTTSTHYFWVVNDTSPGAPVDETVILTLVDSITFEGGVTIPITGATVGTAQTTHTLTILDDDSGSGDPQVSFQFASASRDEGSTDQVVNFNLVLSSAADGTETVDVALDGASTGTNGVDFTFVPGTATFAAGVTTRPVAITIHGNTTAQANRTCVLTLSNPTNCVLAAPSTFTLTIVDDDDGVHETATVALTSSDVLTVPEGGSINVPVVYSGTTGHDPFLVNFGVVGVTGGPSGKAASSDDYVVTPAGGQLAFGTNDLTKFITISAKVDGTLEGNEDVQIRLVSLVDDGGTAVADMDITLATPNQRYCQILDGDQGGGTGVDGDLFDYNGVRLVRERRAFDTDNPHFRCLAPFEGNNNSATEAVEVLQTSPRLVAAGYPVGVYNVPSSFNFSARRMAWTLAQYVWFDLHDGTYAKPDAVPIGTQLQEVIIETAVTSQWDPTRLHDYYKFRSGQGGEHEQFLTGATGAIFWTAVDATNTVIRDVLEVGSGVRLSQLRTASVPPPHVGNAGRMDNVTLYRLGLLTTGANEIIKGNLGNSIPTFVANHGAMELLECQVYPDPEIYNTIGSTPPAYGANIFPERGLRLQPMCLRVRHPAQRLPWPPFWPTWEHSIYIDSPVGPDTYPALEADGTSANYIVGLWTAPRLHPSHPAATFNGGTGMFEGPPYSNKNTIMQTGGRPEYNRTSASTFTPPSSGTIAVVNCDISGFGGWFHTSNSPSRAFSINNHNGRLYFKDVKMYGHPLVSGNRAAGFLWLGHEGSDGKKFGGGVGGPQGFYALDIDGDGREYSHEELVLDGVDINADSYNQPYMDWGGVRKVVLRKFRFQNLGTKNEISINHPGALPGYAFCKEFRTDDLVEWDDTPWTGNFDEYPGWQVPGSPTVFDYYQHNWRDTNFSQIKTLTARDVRNMPTHGPAGYTQTNGLIQQQGDNRYTDLGDGLGTVDPSAGTTADWTTSAYTLTGETPTLPTVDLQGLSGFPEEIWIGEEDADGTVEQLAILNWTYETQLKMRVRGTIDVSALGFPEEIWIGEEDADGTVEQLAILNWTYETQLKMRVRGTIDVSALATTTVQYAAQDKWVWPDPQTQTWTTVAGTFSFDYYAVGGLITNDDASSMVEATVPLIPQDQGWSTTGVVFRVRPNNVSALTTGTKDITVDFLDGANRPQWEYPQGSGTFVNATFSGGGVLTTHVVPLVDFSACGFISSNITLDPNNIPDTLPLGVRRETIGNDDAMRLAGFVSVAYSGQTNGVTGASSLSWVAGQSGTTSQQQSLVLTFTDKTQFGNGDTLVVTLGYADPSGHCQAPSSGLFQTFTVTFENPATNFVEWSGAASETLAEGGGSATYTLVTAEPVASQTTITVHLGGTAIDGTHYGTSPDADPGGDIEFILAAGASSADLVVSVAGSLDADYSLTLEITDGGGLPIGSKSLKTVTLDDLDSGFLAYDISSGVRPVGPRFSSTFTQTGSLFGSSAEGPMNTAWLTGKNATNPANFYQEGNRWVVERVAFQGLVVITDDVQRITFRDCSSDVGDGQFAASSQSCFEGAAGAGPLDVVMEFCDLGWNDSGGATINDPDPQNWTLYRCKVHHSGSSIIKSLGIFTATECRFEWPAIDAEATNNPHDNAVRGKGGTMRLYDCSIYAPRPVQAPTVRPVVGAVRMVAENDNVDELTVQRCHIIGAGNAFSLGRQGGLDWTSTAILDLQDNRIRRQWTDPVNTTGEGCEFSMLSMENLLEEDLLLSLSRVTISGNYTDDSQYGGTDTLISTSIPGGFAQE